MGCNGSGKKDSVGSATYIYPGFMVALCKSWNMTRGFFFFLLAAVMYRRVGKL